jgi:hypothetical protein
MAQVEELREVLNNSPKILSDDASTEDKYTFLCEARRAVGNTPQQSLDSLKARAISDLLGKLKDYLEEPEWDHLEESVREIMK